MVLKIKYRAQAYSQESLQEDIHRSEVIEAGILALKRIAKWPAIGAGSATPLYTDESANLYLQFKCNEEIICEPQNYFRSVMIAHPLSLNRSVLCVVAAEKEELKESLKNFGIQGEIKVISATDIVEAKAKQDLAFLEKLCHDYDTILTDHKCEKHTMKHLLEFLKTKAVGWVREAERTPAGQLPFEQALLKCNVLVNPTNDAYMLKVAYTGHTDMQIKQNIQLALKELLTKPRFPEGLKHFKSVLLKTGASKKSVPIYVNDGEVVELPSIDEVKEQLQSLRDKFRNKSVNGGKVAKPLIVIKKERERNGKRKSTAASKSGPQPSKKMKKSTEIAVEVATSEHTDTPNTDGKKKKKKNKQNKRDSINVATPVNGKKKKQKNNKQNKRDSINVATPITLETLATPNTNGRKKKKKNKQNKRDSINVATPIKVETLATPNTNGKKRKNKLNKQDSINVATPVKVETLATPNTAGKKRKNKLNKQDSINVATPVKVETLATPNTAGKKMNGSQKKKQKIEP